ncbi:MAG: alpha/beta fold hydrolase [Anaerolineae bacterium]
MIEQPILLIHGFNGSPGNWTGPEDRFPEFLAQHGYDPALIRVFSYGYDNYKGKRIYNNLGDVRQIAHRLDLAGSADPDERQESVDRLCEDSVARGGPNKVTIIAHSSGGLIARYYLTRQQPDAMGTQYRSNVGRVIFLGTPHQGVDVEDILDPLPTNLLIYQLMVRLHYLLPPEYHEQAQSLRHRFHESHHQTKQALAGDKAASEEPEEIPAFKELHPHSPFLEEINAPGAMPQHIAYHNIIGDIQAHVRFQLFDRTLLDHVKSFGDLMVTTGSASTIPNAPSRCYPLVQEHTLDVDLSRHLSRLAETSDAGVHPAPLHRWLRSLPAARDRMLEILGGISA